MKKSLSTLILISLVSLFMLPAIMPVMAAPGDDAGTPIIKDLSSLETLIQKIVNWFSWFVLLMAILFLLVAAWTFLTAGGNPEKVGTARQMLIYCLIGIAVAVLAWGMVPLITSILSPAAAGGGTLVLV